MYKGYIHASFNIEKSLGMPEMLSGEYALTDVIRKGALHKNLGIITSGIRPPNPSELFRDIYLN